VISGASLKNKRFAIRRVKRSRAKVGTAFRLRLSEAAKLSIRIDKLERRRRVRRQGTLTSTQRAGAVSLPFRGKVGRRTLKPGRYRATLVATDGAGNRSRPKSLAFTVVRR
jgi:hypothetical protein